MKLLYAALLLPALAFGQVNPAFVSKSNIGGFSKLEHSNEGMFGFEQNGKYGYADKNGNIIAEAVYEYDNVNYKTIPGFLKGHARVKKNGKWGLIDKTGKVVIPFEYDDVNNYSLTKSNVAVSKKEGSRTHHGLLNMQNKVVIPLEYDELYLDSNLVLVKKAGKFGLMDNSGKQLLPLEYSSLAAFSKFQILRAEKDGVYGFIDPKGKWIFEKAKSVYTLYHPSEGMISVQVSGKYGYIDLKGNEVIMTKYDQGYGFESVGLAKVGRRISPGSYSYLYGYIDKKGNEVIPIKYEIIGSFSNGLVYAKDPETNRYGYMDKTGKWVIKPVYLEGQNFDELGGVWVKMTDGKYHYINKAGNDLGVWDSEGKGTTYKSLTNGYGVYENTDYPFVQINSSGQVIKKLDDMDAIYNYSGGLAGYKCKSNSKYGFIDLNGNKVIPCDYTGFMGFADGISRAEITVDGKNKSGYLNARGEWILKPEYDYGNVFAFRDGWGLLKKDNGFFFVDTKGNLKDPPRKYDELTEFRSGYSLGTVKGTPNTYYYINNQLKEEFSVSMPEAYPFWDNVAVVKRNTDYELMNKKGEIFKTLTGVNYLKFSSDGMLVIKQNGKYGFIDDKGNRIVEAKYDSTDNFTYGYGRFKQGNKWGIVDKSGKEIFEARYDGIYPNENNLFLYYNNGWGIMDKAGKVITGPVFYSIAFFEKGKALARMNKTYTIMKSPLLK